MVRNVDHSHRIDRRWIVRLFKSEALKVIVSELIKNQLWSILETGGSEGGGVSDELIGDAIVVGAQVIAASQFVYEEKFIRKYDIPALKVVGLEGNIINGTMIPEKLNTLNFTLTNRFVRIHSSHPFIDSFWIH